MHKIYKYIIIMFFISMLVGALLPSQYYNDMDMLNRSASVSVNHLFGTDFLGRDIFFRMIRGSYNVGIIGISSILISLLIGGFLALLMSRKKTNWRYVVSGGIDILFVFPKVLVALILVAIFGPSIQIAIISIGIFFIPVFYRVIYLSSRSVWQSDFVASARLSGLSKYQIMFVHIIPNIYHIILAQCTIQFAIAIVSEAGLGYLGLSVDSSEPTWGSMMLDVQNSWFIDPYFAIPVGVAMVLTTFSLIKYSERIKNDNSR